MDDVDKRFQQLQNLLNKVLENQEVHEKRLEAIERKTDSLTVSTTLYRGHVELTGSATDPDKTGEYEETSPDSFIVLPEDRPLQTEQDLLHETTPKTVYSSQDDSAINSSLTVYSSDICEDNKRTHQLVTEKSQSRPTILTSDDVLSEQTKEFNRLLEEERYFLRDQLGKAQEDIISRLTGLEQGLQTLTQSVTSLMERERDQTERVAHQPGDSGQSQISLANTAQSGHTCGTIEEFRSVCRELETSIRAVTRAEIAWFDTEVKGKFSTLEDRVNGGMADVLRQMESVDTRLSEELDKRVVTLKTELRKEIEADIRGTLDRALSQQQTIVRSVFNEKVEDIKSSNNDLSLRVTKTINDTNMRFTEQQTKNITAALTRTTEDIKSSINNLSLRVTKTINDINMRFTEQQTKNIRAALARTTEEIKTEWIKSCHEIKETQEAELKSTTETLTAEIVNCKETVKACHMKSEENIQKVTHDICKVVEDRAVSSERSMSRVFTVISEQIKTGWKTFSEQMKEEMGAQLRSMAGTLAVDIVSKCEVTVKDCQRKIEQNIQSSTREISTLLKQQTGKMTTFMNNSTQQIQASLTKACGQIKQLQEVDLKSTTETLTAHILKCTETVKDCQRETNRKIETNGKTLTDKIDRSKIEQFSFVEKECQIIRDHQQPIADLPERTSYIFDFYIDHFITLIKSEQPVYSLPWHVDQLRSTVQGSVCFPCSGDMRVYLLYGRHPLDVGLEPRSGVGYKVTATITDTSGTIADLCVGRKIGRWDENGIINNGDWGMHIGDVRCQKLQNLGFGSKEKDYWNGAILIRFKVDIL